MEKLYSDGELLAKVVNALDFNTNELGLKPNYSIGNNNCLGMDDSKRPRMPQLEY